MTRNPIADLSYRSYEGPLNDTDRVWWAIARNGLLTNLRKRGLWILMAISGYWYSIIFIGIYLMQQSMATLGQDAAQRQMEQLRSVKWDDQVIRAFGSQQIFYLVMTLMCAAATIANDNRSNALLVYLSKPCTKVDYVIGKWLGIFLPLVIMMIIPHFCFWLYGSMAYGEYGFFKQDALMFPKIVVLATFAAATYASIGLAVSSLYRDGRMAGATIAGIYFLSNFFTVAMGVTIQQMRWASMSNGTTDAFTIPTFLKVGYYSSLDGIVQAFAKGLFDADGRTDPFGFMRRGEMVPGIGFIGPFIVVLSLIIVGSFIAWRRVRAVEVV